MRILGTISGAVRKVFKDTFDRSDTISGLGKATDGTLWNAVTGTFKISANRARTDNSAFTYPITGVKLPQMSNVKIELKDIERGVSAGLWITDSGNWFAVGSTQNEVLTGCTTCTNCTGGVNWCSGGNNFCSGGNNWCEGGFNWCSGGNNWCSGGYNTCSGGWNYNCNAYNVGNCNAPWAPYCSGGFNSTKNCKAFMYRCTGTFTGNRFCTGPGTVHNCKGWACSGWACSGYSCYFYSCSQWACSGWACSGYTSVTCGCITTYPSFYRFTVSIASTISQLFGGSLSRIARSLRITTSGSQITAKFFANSDLTDQIDSDLVYTPTGVTLTNQYGIIVMPSGVNQGSSVEEISIERA